MSYDKIALTRPPLARLPPELLALVFENLVLSERTLCAMSLPDWRALIKGLWPKLKTTPGNLLDWAAKIGSPSLMTYAKRWGAADFNKALKGATWAGYIDCMKLVKKWGATEFNWPLRCAASWGNIDCMKLAKEWGAT